MARLIISLAAVLLYVATIVAASLVLIVDHLLSENSSKYTAIEAVFFLLAISTLVATLWLQSVNWLQPKQE